MRLVFLLIGALVGSGIDGAPGFVFGGIIGFLIGWVQRLSSRLAVVEARQAASSAAPTAPEHGAASELATSVSTPARASGHAALPASPPATASASGPARVPRWSASRMAEVANEPAVLVVLQRAGATVRSWFTTGNVPVKVGVVLSLFGVGFLIREAIDRELFNLPIEYRLIGVALFGLALLGLGWRLRDVRASYALSVQGGGVAVLYLVTYAAYGLYGLLPAGAAFVCLLGVTIAAGALAVLQDSPALAVLGIVGGFMAPVLASAGSGDHVVLFGYYAVLNGAVVGVAWFKAWRVLNVLGFLFTFAIGSAWGYQGYRPEHFATTEPFLILFVLVYTVIPILFAHRQLPNLRGIVDGTLVFGTPIVGFGLQSRLVGDTEYGLAVSAVALASLYGALATVLLRRASHLRVLTESLFGLGLVFLTIALPLALDAGWTSAAWALEGVGLVWLGFRQPQPLALLAGVSLQLLAGVTYVLQPGVSVIESLAVLNGHFLGAVLIAIAGWLTSWLYDGRGAGDTERLVFRVCAWLGLAWATAWWMGAGLVEIASRLGSTHELSAALVFVAASGGAAAVVAARVDWQKLNAIGLLLLPAMPLCLLLAFLTQPHPLARYGWLAWPFAMAVHYGFLRYRESQFPRFVTPLHAGAYWLLALVVAWETLWQVDRVTEGVWPVAVAVTAITALGLATLKGRRYVPWPVLRHWTVYSDVCVGGVLLVVLVAVLGNNLRSPGNPAPLPYLPILNPLALTSLFSLFTVRCWLLENRWARREGRIAGGAVATLGLFLLTMAVARLVHHWAGVPFELDTLAGSVVVQSSLSIVWAVTGLLGMVVGARSTRRDIWMGGAALMTVVVLKLFLVELDNTGTVGRVVSFLGVGLLLLIVGYVAPVPPRGERNADAT